MRYLGAVLQSVAGCQRVSTTRYSGFGHSCYIFSMELIGCVVMALIFLTNIIFTIVQIKHSCVKTQLVVANSCYKSDIK